jgi:hypothetical protein
MPCLYLAGEPSFVLTPDANIIIAFRLLLLVIKYLADEGFMDSGLVNNLSVRLNVMVKSKKILMKSQRLLILPV